MSNDPTECARRIATAIINSHPYGKEDLESMWGEGNVWSTDEFRETFNVIGFLAPFVAVRKISTGEEGICAFQHSPRFYFDWRPDK